MNWAALNDLTLNWLDWVIIIVVHNSQHFQRAVDTTGKIIGPDFVEPEGVACYEYPQQ